MNQEGQDILVQPEPLHEFAFALYQKAGVSQEHAQLMADLQVETDLRSVHSHGTRMIPWYVRSFLDGAMNPSPDIRVVQEGPASPSLMEITVWDTHRVLWQCRWQLKKHAQRALPQRGYAMRGISVPPPVTR